MKTILLLLITLTSLTSPGWLAPATAGMLPQVWRGSLTGSSGHQASGQAILRDGPMGAILSLENISVDRVPDGRIYLARDGDRRKGIELGHLETFKGEVSYTLPDKADAAFFNSVVLWCEKFSVEIGRATLTETME